jgi:hypothetical protein
MKMPGFPTPTNVIGVNANGRDPQKSGESPPLQEPRRGPRIERKSPRCPDRVGAGGVNATGTWGTRPRA